MSQKTRFFLGIALFAIVIAGAVFAYNYLSEGVEPDILVVEERGNIAESADNESSESEGQSEPEKIKAPDFTVEDADGNSVKLSDMLGSPVVLNFWASWCPPCKEEMPTFDTVYSELGENVVFMMVDLTDGSRETKDAAVEYIAKMGFSFPVYFDTTQEAAITYGIRSIPTTLFIDKDGYAVAGVQGALDEKSLRRGIELIYDSTQE